MFVGLCWDVSNPAQVPSLVLRNFGGFGASWTDFFSWPGAAHALLLVRSSVTGDYEGLLKRTSHISCHSMAKTSGD